MNNAHGEYFMFAVWTFVQVNLHYLSHSSEWRWNCSEAVEELCWIATLLSGVSSPRRSNTVPFLPATIIRVVELWLACDKAGSSDISWDRKAGWLVWKWDHSGLQDRRRCGAARRLRTAEWEAVSARPPYCLTSGNFCRLQSYVSGLTG